MDAVYATLSVLSLFSLTFSLFSHFIRERLFLSEALVAVIVGIGFGPHGFDLVKFGNANTRLLEGNYSALAHFARIVLAIQIMAAGVALPRSYMKAHYKSISVLLGPVMVTSWIITAIILYSILFSTISFCDSLFIAACLSPTDPVLANSVIKGRFADEHVPKHLRFLLSAESAANDGPALPLLTFSLLIKSGNSIIEPALWTRWLFHSWIYNVGLSVVIGCSFGYIARKALQFAKRHNFVDMPSMLVFGFALALATISGVTLIQSNDLLAVFLAALVFSWDDWFYEETNQSGMQEAADLVFNLGFFVFFGSVIPWRRFFEIGIFRLLMVSLGLLLFRRLPWIMLYARFLPELENKKEVLFTGWFGPMGVGAIFYSLMKDPTSPNMPIIWFVVLTSIIAHGITIPIFHLTTRTIIPSILPQRDAATCSESQDQEQWPLLLEPHG